MEINLTTMKRQMKTDSPIGSNKRMKHLYFTHTVRNSHEDRMRANSECMRINQDYMMFTCALANKKSSFVKHRLNFIKLCSDYSDDNKGVMVG